MQIHDRKYKTIPCIIVFAEPFSASGVCQTQDMPIDKEYNGGSDAGRAMMFLKKLRVGYDVVCNDTQITAEQWHVLAKHFR